MGFFPESLVIEEISGQGLVREEMGEMEREVESLCSGWLFCQSSTESQAVWGGGTSVRAGDLTEWNICLARSRPWDPSPVLRKLIKPCFLSRS